MVLSRNAARRCSHLAPQSMFLGFREWNRASYQVARYLDSRLEPPVASSAPPEIDPMSRQERHVALPGVPHPRPAQAGVAVVVGAVGCTVMPLLRLPAEPTDEPCRLFFASQLPPPLHAAPELRGQLGILESQVCPLDVRSGRTRTRRQCRVQIRQTNILRPANVQV